MRIIFIRHGQKGNEGNPSLTKKGRKQAECLGKFIRKIKIDEFYVSTMKRAKETAEHITKYNKKKPKVVSALDEFETLNMKKNFKKFSKEDKKHFNDLKKFLEKISKRPERDRTIVIVSHGYTNRIILSHFLKLDHEKMLPFMQDETGIDEVYWNDYFKNWRLLRWNDVEHLSKKLRERWKF